MKTVELLEKSVHEGASNMRPIKTRFAVVAFFLIMAVLVFPPLGLARILPAVITIAFIGLMADKQPVGPRAGKSGC